MELQAILVLCGAGVAVAALVLLAGLFSTTGTTYEDAVAQQRKVTTELMELASNKNKPKKSNKKANKKLAKKEKKENANVPSTSDPDSEVPAESGMEDEGSKHHVEFSPPVVVDVPRDSPPHVKNEKKEEFAEKKEVKKTGRGGKSKPAPAPKVEEPKEPVVQERVLTAEPPKEQRKAKKNERKIQQEEVIEPIHEDVVPPLNIPQPSELTTEKLLKQVVVPAPTTQASPPSANKNKKNKKTESNVHALLAGEAGELNIGELVRLVNAASLSRTEIQILTDTLLNKHHDTLPQHSDWSEGPNDPVQKMKKQLAEKEKALTEELELSQTLHAKIKELRTSLNSERARATAATRALEDNASTQRAELHTLQTRLQRLLEDNQALQKEKVQFADAQTQRAQMEVHIQRLQESEATLIQQCGGLQAEVGALQGQLGALQTELNQRLHESRQAMCEASSARDNLVHAQQQVNDLVQNLQEANRLIGDLKGQCQKGMKAEQDAQKEVKQLQEKLNKIPELEAEVQRLKNQAQQVETDADKQKQQLEGELSQAQEELTELRQLKAAPAQNGLPPHAGRDPAEMAKIESAIEALRSELLAAEKSSNEQKQQVARLTEELKQYQDKNNAGASRIEEAKYNEMATVLKSVCPSAAPSVVPSHEWLTAFAHNLKEELHKAKNTSGPPANDRLDEMKAHNEQLQAAVDKYKRIIDDTEGALSRLQQNVSEEEGRWAHKLSELQRQLDEISQRDNQSQRKIVSLEAELRQAVQNSTKHSFTDSERLTEENSRLMAGLTDKHKVDNGPIQMSLEEI